MPPVHTLTSSMSMSGSAVVARLWVLGFGPRLGWLAAADGCWFRPRAEVNVVAVFGFESGHKNATRPGDISLCVSPARVLFSWPESRLTFETAFR